MDASSLEHSTHRSTSNDASTWRSRLEQHDASSGFALHGVRDRALDSRHLEEALLGFFNALGDCRWHLFGLAITDANCPVTVTDDDQRGEAEPTTTFDDLGHAVDGDDTLDVRRFVGGVTAPATALVAADAASPRRSATHVLVPLLRSVRSSV